MIQKGSLLLRVSIGRFVKDQVILIFPLMQSGGLRLLSKFAFWHGQTKGKVRTENMLKRRNFNLASRCPMCCQEEESVDHLFFTVVVLPEPGIWPSPY